LRFISPSEIGGGNAEPREPFVEIAGHIDENEGNLSAFQVMAAERNT